MRVAVVPAAPDPSAVLSGAAWNDTAEPLLLYMVRTILPVVWHSHDEPPRPPGVLACITFWSDPAGWPARSPTP